MWVVFVCIINVSVYICESVCVCVGVYLCLCICMFVLCVCVFVCVLVYVYLFVVIHWLCKYVCVSLCVFIYCVWLCVYWFVSLGAELLYDSLLSVSPSVCPFICAENFIFISKTVWDIYIKFGIVVHVYGMYVCMCMCVQFVSMCEFMCCVYVCFVCVFGPFVCIYIRMCVFVYFTCASLLILNLHDTTKIQGRIATFGSI